MKKILRLLGYVSVLDIINYSKEFDKKCTEKQEMCKSKNDVVGDLLACSESVGVLSFINDYLESEYIKK